MVQNFKQEDFILLESELQEALSLSQKSFEVHIMAFDGVPNYEDHIA
ncbi:hypothetical protein GKC34_12375, partial [Lactobacillus salivarius]|nr:hypothetical protein [Ligilactobacillus salivarius]